MAGGAPTRGDDGARLTLRAIEAFVAVVETGALAAAAERLRVSPSTLSQQVSNLETALGARLVDRSARPVMPTPAGRLFLARARRVLDELSRARAELAEHSLADLPELHLAVIEDFDADVTPALVLALAEALPDCRLTCRTGPSHANLDALAARAVDMAVAADIDALPDGIERHALMRDPYVLITAHGLIGPDADPIETLRHAPMTGFGAPQLMQRQIAAQFRRLRFDAAPRFQFDTNHAAMAMVVRTRGWTVSTPLGFLRTPRFHDRLVMRPLPFSGFARTLSLYAREELLGTLPSQAVTILRQAIAAETLPPALTLAPWLEGSLRLIDDTEAPAARRAGAPAAIPAREAG